MKKTKILDCTIRDGGLVNNWNFSVDFVRDLYEGLNAAGVDYMEIGYKNSAKLLQASEPNHWRFLDDRFLKEVLPEKKYTKLSALVDIGRVDQNDILPREESPLDMIRVACYSRDISKGIELAHSFKSLGYETSLNIMALSQVHDIDLTQALEEVKNSSVDVAYVVDSFGSLEPKKLSNYVQKFRGVLSEKEIGVHTHNNMQLAFANTLAAIDEGATFLDASLYGMGRAAGNCHTELIAGVLKGYDVRPLIAVIEKHMLAMREMWEWGYIIPYMISGLFNEHPRMAMALRESEERNQFTSFYDRVTTVEAHPVKK